MSLSLTWFRVSYYYDERSVVYISFPQYTGVIDRTLPALGGYMWAGHAQKEC